MNPYSRFRKRQSILTNSEMTIAFALLKFFQDRVPKSGLALIEYLILIMYALIPILIWAFTVYVLVPMMVEKPFFRRRILRKYYAEGTWIQEADEPEGKRGLSIIHIDPHGQSFLTSGYHFSIGHYREGEIGKSFDIECYRFEWPKLYYVYGTDPVDERRDSPDKAGQGFFEFRAPDGDMATEFTGRYFYAGKRGVTEVRGRRPTQAELNELQLGSLIPKLMNQKQVEQTRQ
jgi:hypothetical protein